MIKFLKIRNPTSPSSPTPNEIPLHVICYAIAPHLDTKTLLHLTCTNREIHSIIMRSHGHVFKSAKRRWIFMRHELQHQREYMMIRFIADTFLVIIAIVLIICIILAPISVSMFAYYFYHICVIPAVEYIMQEIEMLPLLH